MSLEGGKRKDRITRRTAVAGAAATLLAGAISLDNLAKNEEERERSEHAAEEQQDLLEVLDVMEQPHQYDTRELAGKTLGGMFTKYTGIKGQIGAHADIDFRYRLAQLWKEKLDRTQKNGFYEPGIVRLAHDSFRSYDLNDIGERSLFQYAHEIESAIEAARAKFDAQKVLAFDPFKYMKFSETETKLFAALEKKIEAADLLSIIATEIASTTEGGSLSVAALDFLLKNAGSKFLDATPALFDRELSVGPFQFTPQVIYDGHKNGGPRNGASIINAALGDRIIPHRLEELRGEDHAKTAYLLAVYNLAELTHSLGTAHLADSALAHLHDMPEDTVAMYVAAAHHNPSRARRAFAEFVHELRAGKKAAEFEPLPNDVAREMKNPKRDQVKWHRLMRENELALYTNRTRNTRRSLKALLSQTIAKE